MSDFLQFTIQKYILIVPPKKIIMIQVQMDQAAFFPSFPFFFLLSSTLYPKELPIYMLVLIGNANVNKQLSVGGITIFQYY